MKNNNYQKIVHRLLKKQIDQEIGMNNIELDYGNDEDILVEKDQFLKIRKIHIVCNYDAFKKDPYLYLSKMYQNEDKVSNDIYLTYLCGDNDLHSISLKELVKINIALQKAQLKEEKAVNSFKEYYDIIEEICITEKNT